jgi:hypothetical protein
VTGQLDKPNLELPLAASYNSRGVAGFTNTVTNSLDQRKVNAVYELYKNPLTGKDTLYVVKRPGVADVGFKLWHFRTSRVSLGSGSGSHYERRSQSLVVLNEW